MSNRNIRTRLIALITDPKKEFLIIQSENLSSGVILNQFVYPLLLIFMATTFIGSIVFGAATFLDGILSFIFSLFIIIPALFFSMYMGIWLMKKWISKLVVDYKGVQLNFTDLKTANFGSKSFTLISFSLAPVYLSMIVSGIFPRLSDLINLFGLYSLLVYWHGSAVLFDYPLKTRRLFVWVSLLIYVFIFVAIRFGIKSLFELVLNK